MAIIMTAAHFRAEYEWYAHKRAALATGLEPTIVDAFAAHRRPSSMHADEAVLYDFCHELWNYRRVSDATFAAAIDAFGESGLIELVSVIGYYCMVSLTLNAFEVPLVANMTDPFPDFT